MWDRRLTGKRAAAEIRSGYVGKDSVDCSGQS